MMTSSILNCCHPTLCCRLFLVSMTWITAIPCKTDRIPTVWC